MKKVFFTINTLVIIFLLLISCKIETDEDGNKDNLKINCIYNIETPKEGEVFTDFIKLAGTWTSDKSISRIEIELSEDKEGEVNLYKYKAEIKKENEIKGSWFKTIDITKDNIGDGGYIVKVRFFDRTNLVSEKIININVKKNVVKAPLVTIETPKYDEIVRGSFDIKGKIENIFPVNIEIYLINISEHGNKIKYDASIEKVNDEFLYNCSIDTIGDNKLQDGQYEINVVCSDSENNIATINRLITIDNTAPIIFFDYIQNCKTFGQVLYFLGQSYDDNRIEKIIIRFYDAQNNLVHTVTKSNITPIVNLDIATYENNVNNDYAKIYGSCDKTKGLSDPIYYTLEIFDIAGNCTNNFYFDSYDLIDYKKSDLYKLINNQKVNGITEQEANDIKLKLESSKVTKGMFKLNPINNPTFALIGFDEIKNEADLTNPSYNVITGNTCADITSGLDYYELKQESLQVGMYEIGSTDTIETLKSLKEESFKVDENKVVLEIKSISVHEIRANLKFKQSNMVEEKKYLIRILGEDKKGNRILPKDGIGYIAYKPTSKP